MSGKSQPFPFAPANSQAPNFLRRWLIYRSEIQTVAPSRARRRMVLGLAAVIAFSVSFWAGAGLMLARFLK